VAAKWQTTYTFIGPAEQEIPNNIKGIVVQALLLEKLKKTLTQI
jgi:hypothetical protein